MRDLLTRIILGPAGGSPDPKADQTRLAEVRKKRKDRRSAGPASEVEAVRQKVAGQTIQLTVDTGPYRIAGDQTHALADTVFDVASAYPGDRIGIEVGDRAVVDVLQVRLRPGVTDVDRFIRLGSGVRIGQIDVQSVDQTDPNDKPQDGFLQIRGDDIRINTLRFRNIDRCVLARGANRLSIGSLECTRYSKGVKLERCANVYIGALSARQTSPHAGPWPGFNGLSIEDCTEVHISRVEVDDAAEHAVYLAGGGDVGRHSARIRFGAVVTRRSGQCGFKCKAPVSPSVDVSIETLTVIDAAFGSRPGRNEDGLRVENARGFRVGSLQVRRERGRYSCYAGLFLDGAQDFSLSGGLIENSLGPMVLIEDGRDANVRIFISQLTGRDIGAEGYLVRHANGRPLEELVVVGGRLEGAVGDAVRIEGRQHLATKPNYIRLDTIDVAGAAVRDLTGDPGNDIVITDMGAVRPERPPPRPRAP